MPRPKKEYSPITVKLDKELFDRLSEYCEVAGQTKTVAVERALKLYIEQYESKEGVKITGKEREP